MGADRTEPDLALAAHHLGRALDALGFPPDPEMARTPELVAAFLSELVPGPLPALDPLPTTSHALVVVRELPFQSLCAHHLLPFFGTVTIACRPGDKLAGLGWYPRLVEALARRPQLQERLADQLADEIHGRLGNTSTGVKVVARQLCVELRGTRAQAGYELRALRGVPDGALEAALG